MASVVSFTFNPFQENTYVVYDETGECVIFDPGCYDATEKEELRIYLHKHDLTPVRLINTHCHIDHVFGNRFVAETYDLPLEIHRGEIPVLESLPQTAAFFGIRLPEPSPPAGKFIEDGDWVEFGTTRLQAILTPGHSPASLSFYCEKDRFVIAGDVLFLQSIGRTDLPGGDYDELIASIRERLWPMGDDTVFIPGHGPESSFGRERRSNPFVGEP